MRASKIKSGNNTFQKLDTCSIIPVHLVYSETDTNFLDKIIQDAALGCPGKEGS